MKTDLPRDVRQRLARVTRTLEAAAARLRPTGEDFTMRLEMTWKDLDWASEEVQRLIERLKN